MGRERIILCSGIKLDGLTEGTGDPLKLNLWKSKDGINVKLPVSDLDGKFWRDIPAAFLDLIEIAAYVYSADQAVGRGRKDVETFGDGWRRSFIFHVPVRKPELWQSPKVTGLLTDTLSFLSDDHYEFHFYPAPGAPAYEQYLKFDDTAGNSFKPERVVLYSGGLDSLAGAIKEVLDEKRRIVLVSHRPIGKFNVLRRELEQKLASKAGDLAPLHVPVRINKDSDIGVETTQRSRSFLYASLAATVAQMVGLDEIRFYENGVVSLNLPPCEQIIGSRATRTTHPRVLRGFQSLFTELSGKQFTVQNPFAWKTKGEVIRLIRDQDCGDMIKPSRSCASTWERDNVHTHCGVCSQCVDRRVAVIATETDLLDPVGQYEVDMVRQSIPEEKDRLMMVAYFERANEFRTITNAAQLLEKYNEVAAALHYSDQSADSVVSQILKLHQRHAGEVREAVNILLRRHSDELFSRTLPNDCLVRIINDTNSATSLPAVEANTAKEPKPPRPPAGGEIGRLRYENDFQDIWLGGVHYDLRTRNTARFCIQYLVEAEAFDKSTARHLENEIDPFVREKTRLPALPTASNSNLRIQRYFNDPVKKYHGLCKELIKPEGRTGRFYLRVK